MDDTIGNFFPFIGFIFSIFGFILPITPKAEVIEDLLDQIRPNLLTIYRKALLRLCQTGYFYISLGDDETGYFSEGEFSRSDIDNMIQRVFTLNRDIYRYECICNKYCIYKTLSIIVLLINVVLILAGLANHVLFNVQWLTTIIIIIALVFVFIVIIITIIMIRLYNIIRNANREIRNQT